MADLAASRMEKYDICGVSEKPKISQPIFMFELVLCLKSFVTSGYINNNKDRQPKNSLRVQQGESIRRVIRNRVRY